MRTTGLCCALFLLLSACGDDASDPAGPSGAGGSADEGSGGAGGGAADEPTWEAFAEVDGSVRFLFAGPDDGVWLVTTTDGEAYGELHYDVTLLGPDLAPRCSEHFVDPDRNLGEWIAPAVDPDGNLVLVKSTSSYDPDLDQSDYWADVTRVDDHCTERPWLHLEGLACFQDSTGGDMRRQIVATRDAVFLACGFGGSYAEPKVATEDGVKDLYAEPESGNVTMTRSASGDEVLVLFEASGRVLVADGSTGFVERDESAYLGGESGMEASFSTYAASLVPAGDGYVAMAQRAETSWLDADYGSVDYEDEVVSLLPDRSAGDLQPWLGLETSSPAPTSYDTSFMAYRDHVAFFDDAWLTWGVQATAGLGDAGVLSKSGATLRVVDGDGSAHYAPVAGLGRSAPAGMTQTESGAMVVALHYEEALTLGERTFDSGQIVLARSKHPEQLGQDADAPAAGCKLREEACVRCVDQNRTDRCFSRDLDCIPVLLEASSCACQGQLGGADDATLRACFDPIDQLEDGYVTSDVFRTTCAAECL